MDATIGTHPASEVTQPRPVSDPEPAKPAPIVNGEAYPWDRTHEENRQKELARLETERLSRLPLPAPKAKTLPWLDFCEYWNQIRELPVAPCVRLYVQRWLPVLLPVVEYDRFNNAKESHPSDLKIQATDGALSEDLILQLGGVGDYTFRLNDTRRPWEQGTICQSQLETKRLWDTYPPVFDLKRLDYEDKKNQVYIKFARARGILPREDEQEREENDMANAAVADRALDQAAQERARADQIQREQLDRARAEADAAKAEASESKRQAELATAKAEEAKTKVQPGTPAAELLNVVSSVATLAQSLKPAPDNSLGKFLELEQQREITRRQEAKEERDAARLAAKDDRDRADRLAAELAAVRSAPPAAAVAITPTAPPTLAQQFADMEALMGAAKRITKGGSTAEEEERPAKLDKWVEMAPVLAPIAGSFIQGIFQTILTGIQAWQNVHFNDALARTGGQPKPPAPMPNQPQQPAAEPGKPIPPSAPTQTAEQTALQQTMQQIILPGVAKLIGPLQRAFQNSKTGAEFAIQLIEFSEEGRADYDRIRNVADTLIRLGLQVPGQPGVEQFKNAAAYLFQHFPAFYQKVATVETFGTFLEDFYNMDAIEQQEEDGKQ